MENSWLTGKRVFWLLAGLIAVGALLRFLGLQVQSLWWDELFSWWLSDKDSLGEVLAQAARDVHPPAHPVIIYFVERYLGDCEFWLRFPSALFGVLCIPAMYLLARRMFSQTEGVWAAALTALLWFPIYYSQEARGYTLLFLLCALSMAFWFPMLRAQVTGAKPPARPALEWILYVLCAVGMIYTHHYGSLMVALQGLALLLSCGKRLRAYQRTLLLYLPIVALGVPAWLQAFGQYRLNYLTWLPEPSFSLFTSTYYTFFNRSELIKNLALIITVLPLIRLCVSAYKQKSPAGFSLRSNLRIWTLVVWLVLPFLAGLVATLLLKPMLTIRFLTVSAPAAYLLLARGLSVLTRRWKINIGVGGLFLVLALVDLFAVHQYYSKPVKDQWRDAVAHVVGENPRHPNALLIGSVWKPVFANYYFERLGSDLRLQIEAGKKSDLPRISKEIQKAAPSAVWLIRIHRTVEEGFLDYFKKNFLEKSHQKFIRADVWLFEVPTPSRPEPPAAGRDPPPSPPRTPDR
jgi:mannosyltransferase